MRSRPSAPSGTNATTGFAGEASVVRKSRTAFAPRPWTMLNPSAPSRAVFASRSGGTALSTEGDGGTAVRMTVPGSTSGVQKTVAFVAASDGSIAKAQPPARPHQHGEALGGSGGSLAFGKVSLVFRVAPQPFPGEVRRE